MRDHGGNLDWAIARFGGEDWIDLSTGINRRPYPMPLLTGPDLHGLPSKTAQEALMETARQAWNVAPGWTGLALAGAQSAIQLVPWAVGKGRARVLTPTYNEHAACLLASGWVVDEVSGFRALAGADLAVLVNPNNPDGRRHSCEALFKLARQVGFLVVDESFADSQPDLSLLAQSPPANLLVMRSFGKFYGLAGLRLGFAFGPEALIGRMAVIAGPWPVAGPAIAAGRVALSDHAWAKAMRVQLAQDAARTDALATSAGWSLIGGTPLFRLYDTGDAVAAQERLASHRIWSRIFTYSTRWLRLGLPGPQPEWDRLTAALR